MFVQNFIDMSAAVRELPCSQSFDDAENNTAVASAASNKNYCNQNELKRTLFTAKRT